MWNYLTNGIVALKKHLLNSSKISQLSNKYCLLYKKIIEINKYNNNNLINNWIQESLFESIIFAFCNHNYF